MEQSTLRRDFPNFTGQSGILSIPEAKQQISSEFLISPREAQTTNGESQLEFPFDQGVQVKRISIDELDVTDFEQLDRARQIGWWVPTPKEFGDQIRNQVYDIWR